jgi:E3 SUMO-protein ligase RanBP2
MFGNGKPQEPSPGINTPPTSMLAFGAKSLPGFGDIAKNSPNGGFMFGTKPAENKASPFSTNVIPQLFGGANQSPLLFGNQITPKPADGEDGDGDDGNNNPEEYEPQVDFKPLVALKEVEVKTGEEDEDILFKERCKLYRFHPETKEWKEKGVGEIKILKHKESSSYRVLMRRDQVLKLCANHRILPEIILEVANEKQIRWSTNDYSDNEAKYEILLAKFRHDDEAKRFKNEFEKAQQQYSFSPAKPKIKNEVVDIKPCSNMPSLADLVKVDKGTWSCSQCLVSI